MKKKLFALLTLLAVLSAGLFLAASAEEQFFTIEYYENDQAAEPTGSTRVTYGTDTATKTIQDLGYGEVGRIFEGWRAYWVDRNAWRVVNTADRTQTDWINLETAGMPEGWDYFLYGSGAVVARTVGEGTIRFLAQWNTEGNTFVYYDAEGGNRLEKTSHLGYKEEGKLLTPADLGLQPAGKIFLGWTMQRMYDGKWMILQADGKGRWDTVESLQEGEEVCFYTDQSTVTGFWQSGEIRLYAQWIETVIDVTAPRFGADGTDEKDDWNAIQEALKFARRTDELLTVRIPRGTYYLSDTLDIFSDTNLVLEDGAVIACLGDTHLMLINARKDYTYPGGYDRTQNITIQGGTWDGKGTGEKHNNLILIAHAKNVTIKNTTLINCCGNHFIEYNGVSGGTVSGCTFRDFIPYKGLDYSKDEGSSVDGITTLSEAMQVDYAGGEGTNGADKPADNTPSVNITVTGCTFDNVMSGVGNHHEGDKNTGIKITKNTFRNVKKNCVNLFYYQAGGIEISGNKATEVRRFLQAMNVKGSGDAGFKMDSNTVQNTSEAYKGLNDAFLVLDSSDLTLQNNTVSGFLNGIHMNGSKNLAVEGNTVNGVEEIGIKVVSCDADITGNQVTDCGQYNIATYKGCTGTLEGNTYDLNYGILNEGGMDRGANTLVGHEKEPDYFLIIYHETDTAEASPKTTEAVYGGETFLLKPEELGFSAEGRTFLGWKIYRQETKTWLVKDAAGNTLFAPEVPEGGSYVLYPEIYIVRQTVPAGGILHFYAQWEEKETTDLPGDVNEDNKVDGADVLRLMKYFAEEIDEETGKPYEISEKNADVTGDGKVDEKDLLRLFRYLAGEITELKQK